MKLLSAAVLALTMAVSAPAAAGPPDAEAVRKAASAFDDGSRAYRANKFELAASHFEAADAAVPSARALRMAIRARTEAGQPDRAASLAELAMKRYPDDEKTAGLGRKTVAAHKSALHRLKISCTSACVLAVGVRSVHGQPAKKWTLWVPPGEHSLSASFGGGAGSEQQVIVARAGGSNALSFLPEAGAPKPDPGSSDRPKPAPDPDVAPLPRTGPAPQPPASGPDTSGEPSWVEHPALFFVSLALTAGAGGTLVWSGIDTLQNPGTDAVRTACVGQGTTCPEYQTGRDAQLRTNVLIGVTGGLGLVTGIIGLFVTEWGGDDGPDTAVTVSPNGATMMWRGAF